MQITDRIGVITGAGSGIGQAVAVELARRGVSELALVDRSDTVKGVAESINEFADHPGLARPFIGDVTDDAFRRSVFDETAAHSGVPSICVPAAGITRDSLAVKLDKNNGHADLYPIDSFRQTVEVNLVAPIYWALEMVRRIAEQRQAAGLKRWEPEEGVKGTVIFIGSVSSQGNKGQIAYATTKAGLEGAASTLNKEAIFFGVRCGLIHPGFTDTPMVHALGEEFIDRNIIPQTQLRRLIRPEEIADAICFMVGNSAITGELWADAGWHPSA